MFVVLAAEILAIPGLQLWELQLSSQPQGATISLRWYTKDLCSPRWIR